MNKIVWATTTGKPVEVRVSYLAKEHIISVIAYVDAVMVGTDLKADHRAINSIEIGGTCGKLAIPMAKYIEIVAAVDAIKASAEYTTKINRAAAAEEIERKYDAKCAELVEED